MAPVPGQRSTEAGPKDGWPLQTGFDRFYGILDGFTNFHQPHRLYEDNHALDIDEYPDDYYFTDDLTDRALGMVREVRDGHPTRPWFLYFSHGAVHAPLQARPADLEKYRGRYEAGWDEVRRLRFERQKTLGIFDDDVVLPLRNTEENYAVRAWDDLTVAEKEVFARYQEVFAAMVDNVDQNFGRLRDGLEAMGEWDNTLVVFTSDNGGSREGLDNGTSAYFRTLISQIRKIRWTRWSWTTPAWTCWAVLRLWPTTRRGGPWCRAPRSGFTRSTPTRAAIRCRSSCPRGRA
ncbi:MAG: hypothetical protein Ct9H300mP12_16680 [Acidimicrobiales bacterium]|nr:MAG: hypothetical protein Ct9H300mP12_16680 [Acidimicrobiales bacterium]